MPKTHTSSSRWQARAYLGGVNAQLAGHDFHHLFVERLHADCTAGRARAERGRWHEGRSGSRSESEDEGLELERQSWIPGHTRQSTDHIKTAAE